MHGRTSKWQIHLAIVYTQSDDTDKLDDNIVTEGEASTMNANKYPGHSEVSDLIYGRIFENGKFSFGGAI